MLIGLSVAETISWGVLYYSFAVFIRPIEQEMGWTRPQVTGAFSLALLAAGLVAVPVGHWLDARGARGLMTAGSVLAAGLFAALGAVHSLAALYAVWLGLGVAMAMVLYEPAFAIVATWFVRHRVRALTLLTLFGGLASTLVVPLATWLLVRQGWRAAAVTLALLLAGTTIPLHGLLLRKDPASVGQHPDGTADAADGMPRVAHTLGIASVMAEARFWALTGAITLGTLVTVATSVHLIPYLTDSGLSPARAGAALGAVGLLQLLGRLLFGSIRRRLDWRGVAGVVLLAQAGALAALAHAAGGASLAVFVCLFGAANGMATLVRASTLAELYGQERFGRVSGVVSLFTTLGRAAGPLAASLACVALGGYERTFGLMIGLLLMATALVLSPWTAQR